MGMLEKWHGTTGGYNNHKCRCDPCRLAWNKYCRERKRVRRNEFVPEANDTHGSEKMYQRGCACTVCKSAHSKYRGRLRQGEKSRDGTCEICAREGTVIWDHDHSTGRHRGWLCIQCNQALGLVSDNLETLLRMERYLS
ncbi:HNH endonuclease [Microbacterium phage LeeroyJenkins]|nr:HNH endonuclease [Microbacterium phage LeeroyJenkins]